MKQTRILSRAFILMMISVVNISAQTTDDPSKSLPEEINNWKISEDRIFNNETLYNYIDGGAELFLSFGFSKVFNRIYSQDGQPDILVDIFYMNTSYDAFGVFSFSSGKVENKFGVQSQESTGAIIFWKNNFYISITSTSETEQSKNILNKIAEILDSSIQDKGELPEIIKFLPEKSLDKESVKYFRHYVWQNSHMFISNENILNINQNTQAVLAQYSEKNNKSILIIIKYLSRADATNANEKFILNYNPKLKKNSTLKDKKGKWTGIMVINNFFVGVFNSRTKNEAQDLLNDSKAVIANKVGN